MDSLIPTAVFSHFIPMIWPTQNTTWHTNNIHHLKHMLIKFSTFFLSKRNYSSEKLFAENQAKQTQDACAQLLQLFSLFYYLILLSLLLYFIKWERERENDNKYLFDSSKWRISTMFAFQYFARFSLIYFSFILIYFWFVDIFLFIFILFLIYDLFWFILKVYEIYLSDLYGTPYVLFLFGKV